MQHIQQQTAFMTKKCPECMTSMPAAARRCPTCNKKLGEVNKLGFAKKPVDWFAYASTLIWVQGLCLFIWWAFIKA